MARLFSLRCVNAICRLARGREDATFAERCLAEARQLQKNIEEHAWDGQWYLRAYFDNGEPLGSKTNSECQIDSIPQSWSVISDAGDSARSAPGYAGCERASRPARRPNLSSYSRRHSTNRRSNQGYIKGYIPGVRETVASTRTAPFGLRMAFALMRENERAWELFALLNPMQHGATAEQIAIYKVEPYVMAADVYAIAPHIGRGGWTWYTGSAGWMYRFLTETLLGVPSRRQSPTCDSTFSAELDEL